MLRVHCTHTPREDASAHLHEILRSRAGEDVLLLLSGGSALSLFEHLDVSLLGPHLTISVVDERWTYDPLQSNFAQLTALPIWQHALEAGSAWIDPRPREPEDVYDTAKRFDLALKHWHITHREGRVIATMGIGEDGHTAGILPLPEDPERFATLFAHTTTCVRGYTVPPEKNPHTKRMTTTLTYLRRHVHYALVYVTGEAKRDALGRVRESGGTLAETPARILHEIATVEVFTEIE